MGGAMDGKLLELEREAQHVADGEGARATSRWGTRIIRALRAVYLPKEEATFRHLSLNERELDRRALQAPDAGPHLQ
jgi:hypothetical protein